MTTPPRSSSAYAMPAPTVSALSLSPKVPTPYAMPPLSPLVLKMCSTPTAPWNFSESHTWSFGVTQNGRKSSSKPKTSGVPPPTEKRSVTPTWTNGARNSKTPTETCPLSSERPVGAKNKRLRCMSVRRNSPCSTRPLTTCNDTMSCRRAVTVAPAWVRNTTSVAVSLSMVPNTREPSLSTSSCNSVRPDGGCAAWSVWAAAEGTGARTAQSSNADVKVLRVIHAIRRTIAPGRLTSRERRLKKAEFGLISARPGGEGLKNVPKSGLSVQGPKQRLDGDRPPAEWEVRFVEQRTKALKRLLWPIQGGMKQCVCEGAFGAPPSAPERVDGGLRLLERGVRFLRLASGAQRGAE